MNPERILLTGSSGFYGRSLVNAIRAVWPTAETFGLDVVPPKSDAPDRFENCDITSSKLAEHIQQFNPDTVLHLAFVVNPMRDEGRMHQINVDGTKNLLAAVADSNVKRLFVASSATAYGAWPDNPVPMPEEQPLRSRIDYRYAADKVEVEKLLAEFSSAHPKLTVSWARPCIIYGPRASNFMIPLFTVPPVLTLPGGDNPQMQFVHLDDVTEATLAILKAEVRGPFNVGPPDTVTMKELGKMSGRIALPVPYWLCRLVTTCWWALRLPIFRFPAPLWSFIRYPWVVSSERLIRETDFQFRYSSTDVIRMLLEDAGKLRK